MKFRYINTLTAQNLGFWLLTPSTSWNAEIFSIQVSVPPTVFQALRFCLTIYRFAPGNFFPVNSLGPSLSNTFAGSACRPLAVDSTVIFSLTKLALLFSGLLTLSVAGKAWVFNVWDISTGQTISPVFWSGRGKTLEILWGVCFRPPEKWALQTASL